MSTDDVLDLDLDLAVPKEMGAADETRPHE